MNQKIRYAARRALCIILVPALLFCLFGCGKDDPTTTEPVSSSDAAAETTTEAEAPVTGATEPASSEPASSEPASEEPVTDPKTPPAAPQDAKVKWEDFSFTLNGKRYVSRLTPDDFSEADGWIENTQTNYGESFYPRDHLLAPGEDGYLVFTRADSDVSVRLYYLNESETETRLIRCPCYSANFYGETGEGFSISRGTVFGANEAGITDVYGEPDQEQTFAADPPGKVLLYNFGICAIAFVLLGDSLMNVQFVYG